MYWFLLLFLIIMFMFSYQKEYMTNGSNKKKDTKTPQKSHQKPSIPEPVDASNELASTQEGHCGNHAAGPGACADLYGPTGYNSVSTPPRTHHLKSDKHSKTPAHDFGPEKITAPPPKDDGTQRSDLATSQNAIYFFKPFATIQFPPSGPPQPYLNDFKGFQR